VNGTLFFQASDGTAVGQLWKSDGTQAGTVRVKDFVGGPGGFSLGNLADVRGALFFTAYDFATGSELWKSDGTGLGTVRVADLSPGARGSSPSLLRVSGPRLFLTADDGTFGRELWGLDLFADLAVTKTDSVPAVAAGGGVTYTIAASNLGPFGAFGATVADAFDAALTCSTTCVGAGGAACTAGPFAGNISDSADLPSGGSVTYTSVCSVSPSATGQLSNTATVTAPGTVVDPDPSNNAATDVDILLPPADLSITKTDGQTSAIAGQPVSYTIVAANAGPNGVTGATVTDLVPVLITGATWTCVGSVGGACTAAGSGSIADGVNLPAGASVTYTLTGTLSPSATGTLSNTASIAPPSGVGDPTPGNNSATDTDTILPPPTVTTNAATLPGEFGATLNGTVNPNGSATQTWFEYGPTMSYGNTTPTQGIGSGSTDVAVSAAVSGLACNTTHHFRAVGVNPSGTTFGSDLTFTTGICLPSRVFVSVLGLDTNDCSNIATPCRTLGAALAQVATDGEVIATRSGSYAGATINKGVKIHAASGVVAFSGQPIVVNPGVGGRVVIAGMTVKAVTPGTGTGIQHQSGDLFLEGTVVDGWQVGLGTTSTGNVYVMDSTLRNNVGAGMSVSSASAKASLESTSLLGNGTGLEMLSGKATVSASVFSGNDVGLSAGGGSEVSVEKSQLGLNAGAGVLVPASSLSTVRLTRCLVTGNGVGLQNDGGTIAVTGTNAVRGNGTNTTGTITPAGLQ
jgi:uncharacterized repeat protein (TIGR01451 family)